MKKDGIKVKFWGVRGSYPSVNKDFLKYGGNTSCVEVNAGNNKIILDAGTGIIPLGNTIYQEYISSADNIFDRSPIKLTLLLSHIHQDHIQGLNFFKPINVPSCKLSILGYSGIDKSLDKNLSELIFGKSFPINLIDINADISIHDVSETDVICVNSNSDKPVIKKITEFQDFHTKKDEVIITTLKLNSHPNYGVMCYKITYKNKSVVYATDNECYAGGSKKLELFAKDTDLLIHDSQYTQEDYLSAISPKQGFGHSTFDMAFNMRKNWLSSILTPLLMMNRLAILKTVLVIKKLTVFLQKKDLKFVYKNI